MRKIDEKLTKMHGMVNFKLKLVPFLSNFSVKHDILVSNICHDVN